MRLRLEDRPMIGTTRMLRKFAWLPTRVGPNREWLVWLEYYGQWQMYKPRLVGGLRTIRTIVAWYNTSKEPLE